MKKVICTILLLIFCTIAFTGCFLLDIEWNADAERNSLEEYIEQIKANKVGYSSIELDMPSNFLPNISFFDEYNYIDGGYYWYVHFAFYNPAPEIAILHLKYDESTYYEAKQYMLDSMELFEDKFYTYNDYTFYKNKKFDEHINGATFPKEFTMACYNDANHTLVFLGFFAGNYNLEEKYLDDIEGNWMDFIDQYYGEYYDFSK
ncbi:MAG: hypothetical protein IKC58_00160 [Clostridia bacterium]|nr:hypothetical protein [Clostridia bacterium]MBR2985001.1 hypothetical protein [Clostridia bacterium]